MPPDAPGTILRSGLFSYRNYSSQLSIIALVSKNLNPPSPEFTSMLTSASEAMFYVRFTYYCRRKQIRSNFSHHKQNDNSTFIKAFNCATYQASEIARACA